MRRLVGPLVRLTFKWHIPRWIGVRLYLGYLVLTRRRRIEEYCRKHPVRRLQLGSGISLLPDWLNSDGFDPSSFTEPLYVFRIGVLLDVLRPFPLAHDSVDYIFHEHLIEHLSYEQGQFTLRECRRVLRRGGRIRIATPDLATLISIYGSKPGGDQARYIDEYIRCHSVVWCDDLAGVKENKDVFVINHGFRAWGHQFIYDFPTLKAALDEAGFTNVIRCESRKSNDPHLCGLECRQGLVGSFDALIVEAEKPNSTQTQV